MQNDPYLAWPEYLRTWLSALRYHPEQHYLRGPHHDGGAAPTLPAVRAEPRGEAA